MKTSRRNILLSSLALASTGAALGSCKGGTPDKPSKATASIKKIKWKMATAFPKNFPGSDLNAQKIKNKIEKASEGQLKLNILVLERLYQHLKYLMQLEMEQLIVEFQLRIIGYLNIKPFLFFVLCLEE